MSSTMVQINVIPIRMLTTAEAARHCGRSLTRFKIESPVDPIKFGNGDRRYDVKDLDRWLDGLKAGVADHDTDAILEKLGT
jgi:hypothetical protein